MPDTALRNQLIKLRNRGFTLIEIMVTVFIIAVMASLLVGYLGNDADRLARLEANRFMSVANEVRNHAIVSGEPVLLEFDESGYVFRSALARNNVDDELLRRRTLTEPVELDADILDRVVSNNNEVDALAALVMFTNIGEVTAFEVSFSGDELNHIVWLNEEGEFEYRVQTRL